MIRPETLDVDWNKVAGLVPAIVQDASTLQLLMLGYMNPEALAKTSESGLVTFYSRSRNRIWQKGESSGHILEVEHIELDCDRDSIWVLARPRGATCHRNTTSCFSKIDAPGLGWLARLESVIDARKTSDPETSYTALLLSQGVDAIAKKVGEEAVEVALSAATEDGRVVEESADLLYHLTVLLRASGHRLEDVVDVLRQRHETTSSKKN